jgi:RluA family pseudouridine synthase
MTHVVITKWFHKPISSKYKRLQEAAISQFSELPSRKSVKKALKDGRIFVNGVRGGTGTWVEIGDKLFLENIKQDKCDNVSNTEIIKPEIKVVWEDDFGACVVKTAGIETNGISKITLEKHCIKALITSKLEDRLTSPRTVHRLDRATHGLVLVAKTLSMASGLGGAFKSRKVLKSYTALIEGTPLLSFCEINMPIDGKSAYSRVEVLGSSNWPVFGSATLIKIYPKTGRKHQIRKHLAMTGHPIIGDNIYCGVLKYTGQGMFLACTDLQFTHPITGEVIIVETKLPRKFKHITHKLNLS